MSFISKDHFNMALKGVKRLIDQVSKNITQSDWNETDKASSAYIQNKPFGESGLEYVFVDIKDAKPSGQAATVLSSTCEYELIPGNIYKVIINGVEKEIECVTASVYPNRKCLMLDTDSSHSNKVIFQDNNKSYIYSFTSWFDGTASVKVIGKTQPTTRLSEQYIPNTIARVSDVDEAISSEKGKIFYGTCGTSSSTSAKVATVNGSSFVLRQGAMVCIYFTYKCNSGSVTLNVNNTGAKSIRLSNSTSLPADCWGSDTYVTFLYDGAYWNIISVSISNASATTGKYGLTMLSSSTSSTSTSLAATPSAVKKAYDLANAALPKSGGTLTGNLTLTGDPASNLHAATKQYVDNALKNISEQMQADWNQDEDTAIDFIKNKTHYDSKKLLVEQIYTLDDNGAYSEYDPSFTLEVGVEYEVIFDDVVYQCIGQDCYGNPDYGAYIGNGSYANRPSSSEEPFYIKYENYYDGPIFSILAEVPGSHKIIISKGKLKQLDEKFIPNAIARKTDIPEKLSEMENDLFYANATEVMTLTRADFVPKYVLDEDGNPTDQIECYYYKSTPALDWFTSPDKIGFIIQFTEDDELITVNHHVPGVTAQWDDDQQTENGYIDDEESMPFIYCDDCGVEITSGINALNHSDIIPEDAFYITSWWGDWDSENDVPVVGFDSITIYRIDVKKISKYLYDYEDIDKQISELDYNINETWDYVAYVSDKADNAKTAANNAQTTADQAKTTADNAQTTADQAKTTADKNAVALLTLGRIDLKVPFDSPTIAYGNGKFVVAKSDKAAYSEDGITWTETTMPISQKWSAIAYGNGKFVAISGAYTGKSAYSEDGITWTETTMPISSPWSAIAYGNGKFVATNRGSSSKAAYSEDGITWTETTVTNITYLSDIVYGNDKFVAISEKGHDKAAYSEDGITWTETTMPISQEWSAIAYGNGKFVAIPSDRSGKAACSEDGITWTETTMPISQKWYAIAYGNGKFVAIPWENTDKAAYSEDGITWTETTMPISHYWNDIAYGNGKFVATVGNEYDRIVYSEDGITWTDHVEVITMNGVDVTNQIRKLLGGF